MMWIGLLPYNLVIKKLKNESQDERDRRAETRKRKREEMEQERQDALFDTNVEVGNDQEWDDGM